MANIILTFYAFLNIIYTPDTLPVEPGIYQVQIESEDENAQTYVDVTIVGDDFSVLDDTMITASDFTLIEDVEYNMDDMVRLSNAKAWSNETGEEYPIVGMEIVEEADDYIKIKFETVFGVSVEVVGDLILTEEYVFKTNNIHNVVDTGNGSGFIDAFSSLQISTVIIYSAVIYCFVTLVVLFVIEQRAIKKAITVKEGKE